MTQRICRYSRSPCSHFLWSPALTFNDAEGKFFLLSLQLFLKCIYKTLTQSAPKKFSTHYGLKLPRRATTVKNMVIRRTNWISFPPLQKDFKKGGYAFFWIWKFFEGGNLMGVFCVTSYYGNLKIKKFLPWVMKLALMWEVGI